MISMTEVRDRLKKHCCVFYGLDGTIIEGYVQFVHIYHLSGTVHSYLATSQAYVTIGKQLDSKNRGV